MGAGAMTGVGSGGGTPATGAPAAPASTPASSTPSAAPATPAAAPQATPAAAPQPPPSTWRPDAPATPAADPASDATPGAEASATAGTAEEQIEAYQEPAPPAWDDLVQARAQHAEALGQVSTLEAQIAQYEEAIQPLQVAQAEYQELRAILRRNPDILEILEEREKSGGQGRGPADPAMREVAALKRQLQQREERERQWQAQQQQRQAQQAEQARMAETGRQLDESLRGLMRRANLPDSRFDDVRRFVLDEAARRKVCDLKDVPYLFDAYYRQERQRQQEWEERYVGQKGSDARGLPPAPGAGGSAPITGAPPVDALGKTTQNRMVEGLRRLGWGANNGAAAA